MSNTPELQTATDIQDEPIVRPVDDYWSLSRQPLTSLAFTAPLLLIYEAGLLCLGRDAVRNGAEAWLRTVLETIGFTAYFLLPILIVGILLAWQHLLRQPWRVSRNVLYGMGVECLLLSIGLWLFWKIEQFTLGTIAATLNVNFSGTLGRISCYSGAGIYEELLFRLILLNFVIGLLAWLHASPRASVSGGIVLTSLLFSAAHYIPPFGDPFDPTTFVFRFAAGTLFALLFRYRGFGIAAGTHAFYDVLVGLSA